MGIPALSMISDLATDLAAGKVPPELANGLTQSGAADSILGVAPFGTLIFGGIGTVAFIFGKKRHNWKNMLIGALLVGYPFLPLTSALLVYAIGIALCFALYATREKKNDYTHG